MNTVMGFIKLFLKYVLIFVPKCIRLWKQQCHLSPWTKVLKCIKSVEDTVGETDVLDQKCSCKNVIHSPKI